jgi:hypothetical protein
MLRRSTVGETFVLDDVPIDVRLSVLFAPGEPQEHGGSLLSTEDHHRK